VLAAAVLAHVAAHVWLALDERFFACEDDPYRAYIAYLLHLDPSRLIGKLWPPGFQATLALGYGAGLPSPWAGVVLTGAFGLMAAACAAALTRALAPDSLRGASGLAAAALVLGAPMTVLLGHSQLSDLPHAAIVLGAAAGVAVWWRSESLVALAGGAAALAVATWFRYESWTLTPLLPLFVVVVSRRRGWAWPRSLGHAAVAALCGVGPAAWMLAQHLTHGDALEFLRRAEGLTEVFGARGRLEILGARAQATGVWGAAAVAWAVTGLWTVRAQLGPAAIAMGLLLVPVLVPVALGQDHPVFADRLALLAIFALVPPGAIALASLLPHAEHARGALLASAAAMGLALMAPMTPAAMWDPSSVAMGQLLRSGALDEELGGGRVLVERPVQRPPFGWASVGILWGEWDRTLWGTDRGETWELVGPTDVEGDRQDVGEDRLAEALESRGVRAAWVLTDAALDAFTGVWPRATPVRVGEAMLLLRPPE
jgi:hypothetical protein